MVIIPEHLDLPDFEIKGKLGRGAYSQVYLARHSRFERDYAIKVIDPLEDLLPQGQLTLQKMGCSLEEYVTDLFKRLGIVSQIRDCANLPEVIPLPQQDRGIFVYGESYEGDSNLEGYVSRNGPFKGPELKDIVLQILAAVTTLHTNPIKPLAHLDIKPSNIVYDEKRKKATLTDFGTTSFFNEEKGRHRKKVGSAHYRAPELFEDTTETNAAMDVWAMGATIYYLATGKLLYPRKTEQKTRFSNKEEREAYEEAIAEELNSISQEEINKVAGEVKEIDLSLYLQKDPKKRITIDDAIGILEDERFIEEKKKEQQKKQRKKYFAGLAATAALCASGLLYSWFSYHTTRAYEQAALQPLIENFGKVLDPAPDLLNMEADEMNLRPDGKIFSSSDRERRMLYYKKVNNSGQKMLHITEKVLRAKTLNPNGIHQGGKTVRSYQIPDVSDALHILEEFDFDIIGTLKTGLRYSWGVSSGWEMHDSPLIDFPRLHLSELPQIQSGHHSGIPNYEPLFLTVLSTSRRIPFDTLIVSSLSPAEKRFNVYVNRSVQFHFFGAYPECVKVEKKTKLPYMYVIERQPLIIWQLDGLHYDNKGDQRIARIKFENEGTHTIECIVSDYNGKSQSERFSWLVHVIQPNNLRADLTVKDFMVDLRTLNHVYFGWNIENIGFSPMSAESRWEVYLDNQLLGQDDLYLDNISFLPEAGQKIRLLNPEEFEFQWAVGLKGKELSKGLHTLKLVVDPDNKIDDANRENNFGYLTFEIK